MYQTNSLNTVIVRTIQLKLNTNSSKPGGQLIAKHVYKLWLNLNFNVFSLSINYELLLLMIIIL